MKKPNLVADLADEYGRLDAELASVREKLKRHEALGKLLRASAADKPAELPVTIAGAEYEVTLGSASVRTVIVSIPTLYKKLGRETFLQIANVTLKALQETVHPAIVAALTSQERTGPRKIDVRKLIANSSQLTAKKAA